MEEKQKGAETEIDDSSRAVYEIGYHIVPSVPEDKLGEEVSSIKDLLEKQKAIVISEELPKLRALAYEMRKESAGKYQKYNSAYFGWIKFEVDPAVAPIISEAFAKNRSILRHLLIRTVRENTLTVPRIPSYKRISLPVPGEDQIEDSVKTEGKQEKPVVSEAELDKAIDAVIAE